MPATGARSNRRRAICPLFNKLLHSLLSSHPLTFSSTVLLLDTSFDFSLDVTHQCLFSSSHTSAHLLASRISHSLLLSRTSVIAASTIAQRRIFHSNVNPNHHDTIHSLHPRTLTRCYSLPRLFRSSRFAIALVLFPIIDQYECSTHVLLRAVHVDTDRNAIESGSDIGELWNLGRRKETK
jgi:hypothetical protein